MQTPPGKGPAVTDRVSHRRLWLTVGLGLVLDLASKSFGWQLLGGTPEEGGRTVVLIPGWLRLIASHNPGVVFGFDFADRLGLGPDAGRILTVALTTLTAGLIFYIFAASRSRQRWLHLWCGLVLAGALGNLFDRLVYGSVRDLIQITAHATVGGMTLDWPYVFNLADVYLVVGVVALAVVFIFGKTPADAAKSSRKDA